jgi:acyl-CoA hydrolase
MTEIVLPNDTNTYGRALGGTVLGWSIHFTRVRYG